MDVDYMELRKGAITEAKKTTLTGKLTMTDLSVVKLMDVIRKADWNSNWEAQEQGQEQGQTPVIRPLETTAHSSALLLQERGIKPQSACDLCIKTKNKPFQSCVCAPAFRRHALRLGACANCIWHGREAHCSLREDFVAAGGKKWMYTLDLIVLHGGGLLFSEGIGRRLQGLPGPVTRQAMSRTPTASKATSSKPALAPAPAPTTGRQQQRQRQPPLTKSKVEMKSSRRLAGNISTSILGKRSASASSSTEPESEPEPRNKRTRHAKDCDGKLVPWPCTTSSWNDPDALKTIYSDLRRHMCAVKRRIAELDKSVP
ncbi:uncharacterized protein NFIA_082060 [Aspergillus fischeri NRRL 181]|uniref:Uncharacterized protein n=1 Tax=Neosartorya fischeri (strain ATCC 1020 / DSM 3700 / CBS 544.65 / FGSC A1164 / JCM 1740 / NRRL 181 / WB 181) TaxID=331117 RepID=A1DFV2_NEOFI|nr:uncharacterized protein NFIA_082060 [Aspergillus fischeri NRRL 181]EAW18259.1 hypothetical protein NFIA_082060 [Aspergillus fischeri NRRL 181]KAG2025020.1 hypothetical protein GB937_003246 [Aspergillus fischeri]